MLKLNQWRLKVEDESVESQGWRWIRATLFKRQDCDGGAPWDSPAFLLISPSTPSSNPRSLFFILPLLALQAGSRKCSQYWKAFSTWAWVCLLWQRHDELPLVQHSPRAYGYDSNNIRLYIQTIRCSDNPNFIVQSNNKWIWIQYKPSISIMQCNLNTYCTSME